MCITEFWHCDYYEQFHNEFITKQVDVALLLKLGTMQLMEGEVSYE